MPNVAQRFQADRLRFPGLLPREILVLKAWLTVHESEYDRFEYNVRVGTGFDPGEQYPDNIRQSAIMNTQKRIDMVAWHGDSPTIAEVKDRATAAAIGQLVVYDHLWREANPLKSPPRLLLIANRLQDDIGLVLARANIELKLQEADFSSLRK